MDLNQPEDTLNIEAVDAPIVSTLAYPNIKYAVWLFFVLLFYMVVLGTCAGILLAMVDAPHSKSPLIRSSLNLLMYISIFLITIRYAVRKRKKLEYYTPETSSFKLQFWMIPVLIVSTVALVVFLERVEALIPMPISVQKFFERAFAKDALSIVTMVLAAPIFEEILCRGIILQGLLKNYSPNKAILISATFFAVMHMNPWQAVPAFFGGLFLGWVYYRTQSVIPGMIIHATVNTTASLFLFLPKNQQNFLSLLGLPYYIVLCFLSILIFVAGCIIIDRRTTFPTSN